MNSILRYTSTNGKIVLPLYSEMEDGNNILHNTYKDGVGIITFKAEVKTIPQGLFRGSLTLESISIPSSVKAIDDSAFEKCRHLKKVNLSDGLLSIGKRAFAYTDLGNVVIPSSVLVVSSEAFSHCECLTTVKFSKPISAMVIGTNCFLNSPTEIAII